MKTNEIADALARLVLFTIGGIICLGNYELALRMFGVLIIIKAIGTELKNGQNEN
jgi:hypothetical protein